MNVYIWTDQSFYPTASTLAYFPLAEDGLDKMGNYTLSNTGTATTGNLGRTFTSTSVISPNVTSAKTILAWLKFNSTTDASTLRCVFYNFNFSVSSTPGFMLYRSGTMYTSGTNVTTVGNWYLIGLTVGTNLVGYINGVAYPLSYSGTMDVAADQYNIINTTSGNVTISDCIIESKTWTQSEIQQYYNATKSKYGL